jgi:hypothetical protein
MPGIFAYSASTNTVTVTGGTSIAPADFASLVAADRAETLTLKAAVAPALGLTLGTPIRPCEKLALPITFVLTGTNAGLGDTLGLTGTDAWGTAQSESISVAGGNGTYVSTKKWRSITTIDCAGFNDGVGTVTVTQPQWGVIWDKGNRQYQLDCYVNIGNGSTSTYFSTSQEHIVVSGDFISNFGTWLTVKNNATFVSGILEDLSTKRTSRGSSFISQKSYIHNLFSSTTGGVLLFYSSYFSAPNSTTYVYVQSADRIWNCLSVGYANINTPKFSDTIYNTTLQKGGEAALKCDVNAYIFENVTVSDWVQLCKPGYTGIPTFRNCVFKNIIYIIATYHWTGSAYFIDCKVEDWKFSWAGYDGSKVYRQQSFNLHLTDKNGNDLSSATVSLKDNSGALAFSINTGADGKIPEQVVSRGSYDPATGNTMLDYGPHTLAIAKSGYQTYTDILSIDRKIDLEIVLKPIDQPPGAWEYSND